MTTELWYPGARKWQGNPQVTGYPDSYAASVGYIGNGAFGPKRGAVLHSADGDNWDVIHDLLLTKSWHFTIGFDRVEQHHAWNVNCWHCSDTDPDDGIRGNFELVGIEALGKDHPLTEFQINEEVKLSRWLAEQNERSIFHRFDGFDPDEAGVWVLAEHNEIGNTYTDCPSGRIPWAEVLARLEDELTMSQYTELKEMIDITQRILSAANAKQTEANTNTNKVLAAVAKNLDGRLKAHPPTAL